MAHYQSAIAFVLGMGACMYFTSPHWGFYYYHFLAECLWAQVFEIPEPLPPSFKNIIFLSS